MTQKNMEQNSLVRFFGTKQNNPVAVQQVNPMRNLVQKFTNFKGVITSKQVLEITDPNLNLYGRYGLKPVPWNLEELYQCTIKSTYHMASINAQVADIIADGPMFISDEAGTVDEDAKKWWDSFGARYPATEILRAVWRDFKIYGFGAIELQRDEMGNLKYMFAAPSRYLRLHADERFAAIYRSPKLKFFRMWSDFEEEEMITLPANVNPGMEVSGSSSELLFFCRPGAETVYGAGPEYLAALNAINLTDFVYRYNIRYHVRNKEPNKIIILPRGEGVSEFIDELNTKTPGDHGTVILMADNDEIPNIQVVNLEDSQQYTALPDLLDKLGFEITSVWRMPAARLGKQVAGMLAGNAAEMQNRTYKESVVDREQEFLTHILTKVLAFEWEKSFGSPPSWKIEFKALDLTDQKTDAEIANSIFLSGLSSRNEGRTLLKLPSLPDGDKDHFEILADLKMDSSEQNRSDPSQTPTMTEDEREQE